jgi:hypothetical protein
VFSQSYPCRAAAATTATPSARALRCAASPSRDPCATATALGLHGPATTTATAAAAAAAGCSSCAATECPTGARWSLYLGFSLFLAYFELMLELLCVCVCVFTQPHQTACQYPRTPRKRSVMHSFGCCRHITDVVFHSLFLAEPDLGAALVVARVAQRVRFVVFAKPHTHTHTHARILSASLSASLSRSLSLSLVLSVLSTLSSRLSVNTPCLRPSVFLSHHTILPN